MKIITSELLRKFILLAGEKLTGRWVILGGSVLHLMDASYRVTNDIDVAGPKEATNEQFLLLMEIAEKLHLPVEAINQASAYFLYKIKDWDKNLVRFHSGKKATFFYPNLTLFLLLKIQRLSETDLTDCLKMLEVDVASKLDKKRMERELKNLIKNKKENGVKQRAQKLLEAVNNRLLS